MNVTEYLCKKYSVETPKTMLACEARVFGIPYPLKAGWLGCCGSLQITGKLKDRLVGALRAKKGAMAAAGLAALGEVPVPGQASTKTGRRTSRKKEAKARKALALQIKLADKSRDPFPSRQPTPATTKSGLNVVSDAFLQTFEWRRVRMVALKKYGAVCQCCGASPATGAVMNVDHIKPRRLFPHLALNVENLQVLCHECNHGKGNWDMTDWREVHQEPAIDPEALSHLRSIMLE